MTPQQLAELQACAAEEGLSLQDYLAKAMRIMGLREVAPGKFLLPKKLPILHPEGGILKPPAYEDDNPVKH